jgi:hypothetical protein
MVLKKAVQGCLYWFQVLYSFLFVVPVLPFVIYCQCWLYMADQMQLGIFPEPDGVAFLGGVLFLFALPCLPWILLYGYVIIPNEPYVKFCKDGWKVGVERFGFKVASNETETWECPPKPGSTWVKQLQSTGRWWQCNETYCTADELASPESCLSATLSTTYDADQDYHRQIRRTCDNWSEDNPACCGDYTGSWIACEYCIPDRGYAPLELLWAISTFAGIATFIPFFGWSISVWDSLIWERDQSTQTGRNLAREVGSVLGGWEFSQALCRDLAREVGSVLGGWEFSQAMCRGLFSSRLAIEEKAKKEAEEKAKKEAEEKAKKDAEAAEQGV